MWEEETGEIQDGGRRLGAKECGWCLEDRNGSQLTASKEEASVPPPQGTEFCPQSK